MTKMHQMLMTTGFHPDPLGAMRFSRSLSQMRGVLLRGSEKRKCKRGKRGKGNKWKERDGEDRREESFIILYCD